MLRLTAALPSLYGVRAAVTLTWIGALVVQRPAETQSPLDFKFVVLIALYPAIDVLACLIDLRIDNSTTSQIAHWAEVAGGAVAAVLMVTGGRGSHRLVATIGAWAVVTGGIQLGVALRRVRFVRGQWFMAISGAGSLAAGTSFIGWHGSARDVFGLMTQYAGGGILWFLVAAMWGALFRPGAARVHSEQRAGKESPNRSAA
jgi:hypothetical protein